MRNLLQSARALCLKVLHFTIILITSLAILLAITNMQCAKYVGLLSTANAVTSNTTLEDKSGKNTKKKKTITKILTQRELILIFFKLRRL